jgi:hypothetical protein
MAKPQTFKWTIEIEIAECWVADGADLTDDQVQDMIETRFGFATSDEVKARVIKAPPKAAIRKAQGS